MPRRLSLRGSAAAPSADAQAVQATRAELEAAREQFVAAWGQMGSAWGISRTMAEVHALLFITGEPMNTDDVMSRLAISRGNASMSLRALVEWGLISRVHKRGDRKEYFGAEQDPWSIFRIVVRERLRRELHPLIAMLFDARELTSEDGSSRGVGRGVDTSAATAATANAGDSAKPVEPREVAEHNARLDAMLELLQTADRLAERFVGADGKGLKLAASVLAKVS